jgi:hypothetical protein
MPNAAQRAAQRRNMVARGKREARCPWILLDKIPRPEGAQYSVARFAGSVIQGGRAPRVTLAALAHPGLLSAVPMNRDSVTRTSGFTLLFGSCYQVGAIR